MSHRSLVFEKIKCSSEADQKYRKYWNRLYLNETIYNYWYWSIHILKYRSTSWDNATKWKHDKFSKLIL